MPKKGDTLHFSDDIQQASAARRGATFVVERIEEDPRRGWVAFGRVFKDGEDVTQGSYDQINHDDGRTEFKNTGLDRFSISNFKETQKLWQDLRSSERPTGDAMTGEPRTLAGKIRRELDAPLVELRKRESVLKSLLNCLG